MDPSACPAAASHERQVDVLVHLNEVHCPLVQRPNPRLVRLIGVGAVLWAWSRGVIAGWLDEAATELGSHLVQDVARKKAAVARRARLHGALLYPQRLAEVAQHFLPQLRARHGTKARRQYERICSAHFAQERPAAACAVANGQ